MPGKHLDDKPAYVLTSKETFSGAEEFSYNLKNLKRATIIGETTGGGAHPVSGHRIDDHFMIGVPSPKPSTPSPKPTGKEPASSPTSKFPQPRLLPPRKNWPPKNSAPNKAYSMLFVCATTYHVADEATPQRSRISLYTFSATFSAGDLE